MLLWNPVAYQMVRPPLFAQPGQAANIFEWFAPAASTLDMFGVTFPTYRLFIIVLGILMLIALSLTMGYSRLGMIIRAGVQDREMVEALGINVRQVFTLVFVIGVGLAALGGIGAAPFIPVRPIWVMSSRCRPSSAWSSAGWAVSAGQPWGRCCWAWRAPLAITWRLQFGMSPAIAEASTVIIMAIVLLVRPAGLFGRKE